MAESDFYIWYKSKTESFLYINERSNIKDEWLNFSEVLEGKYSQSIIKPINKYVENLYQPPSLVSIDNNIITLEQSNFAEIMLLKAKGGKNLTAMEKVHMRQFYLSDLENKNEDCFDTVYRLFIPWIIDIPNLKINIEPIPGSPFYVFDTNFITPDYKNFNRIDPEMLLFQFKNIGPHMIDSEYGKISRNTSMYRLNFEADDIMVKQIEEFYGKD